MCGIGRLQGLPTDFVGMKITMLKIVQLKNLMIGAHLEQSSKIYRLRTCCSQAKITVWEVVRP